MYELKTKETNDNVIKFLDSIEDTIKRNDCFALIKIMKDVTNENPKMWGANIIGFGKYHYKYKSGHAGEMCVIGLSPRKQNISLYGILPDQKDLFEKLGKYKTGKGCLYLKKLNDVDATILEKLVRNSYQTKISKIDNSL